MVVCGCMISCQDHDEFVGNVIQAKTQAFDETFVEAYGEIQAGHDWGFGSVGQAIRTRSTIKEAHELPNGLVKPTLQEGEAAYVMNWFQTNSGEASEGLDWDTFFIVYVGGNTTVNIHKHEWDQNYFNNNKNNGATSNFSDIYLQNQSVILDYLHINGEHMQDWNANNGPTLYVYNSKADDFKARNSYITSSDATTTEKWKLAKINVPGVGEGWYVGLSAYAKKTIGTYETLPGSGVYEDRADYTDYDRENFYDDWVFKIVPADGPAPQPKTIPQVYEVTEETTSAYYEVWQGKRVTDIGRVMAEDLGSSDKNDMDYNDVVFEARIVTPYTEIRQMASEGATEYNLVSNVDINNTSYTASDGTPYANIKLLAAGGTIPINVAGIDVHNAFGGIGKTTMINTENPNMTNGTYATRGATDLEKDGGSKDFEYTTIDAIPIAAQYANGVVEIENTYGKVPHKICVPTTAPWPIERVEMNTAYGNKFGSGLNGATGGGYVQDRTVQFWNYAVSGNVNNLEGFGQSIGDVFDETRTASGTVNGQTTYTATLEDAKNTTYPTVESGWTIVWTRGDNDGYLYNDGSSHGVYIDKAKFSGITVGSKVRIYGVYRSGFNVYTAIGNGSEANYNQAGYIELEVANDNHAKTLAEWSGLSITGERFTVTNVAIKVAAQQEPTVPERRGTVVWGANEGEGNTTLNWDSSTVFLSKDYLAGKGVKENSIIRFYGIGLAKDWQMKVNADWAGLDVTGWSEDDKGVHSVQNYWGNNSQYNQGFEFTMNVTKAIANQILDKGLRISGVNFKLMYITVQNPSTPSTVGEDGGTVVYDTEYTIENNPWKQFVESSVFTNAKEGSIIRIYGEPTIEYWGLRVVTGHNGELTFKNQTTNAYYKEVNPIVNGVITLELTAGSANMLRTQDGLYMTGNGFKVTKITYKE